MESEIFYHVETVHADCPSCNTSDIVSPTKLLWRFPWLRVFAQSIENGTFQFELIADLMTMTIKPE